jgi:hypothetical protein
VLLEEKAGIAVAGGAAMTLEAMVKAAKAPAAAFFRSKAGFLGVSIVRGRETDQ